MVITRDMDTEVYHNMTSEQTAVILIKRDTKTQYSRTTSYPTSVKKKRYGKVWYPCQDFNEWVTHNTHEPNYKKRYHNKENDPDNSRIKFLKKPSN